MTENTIYGPHLGGGLTTCTYCREGTAEANWHCRWCGLSFPTYSHYTTHMDGGTNDHYDKIRIVLKLVMSIVPVTPAEMNWKAQLDFFQARQLKRLNSGSKYY